MRIQHNIMAMNAYRNYNNNTKALSGNLEKLSSGYKINRAGDDAAGLAISEKMRAQITGLNAAQKNVKDGISLVKTAEGAMQEIQDMLNRMDYLATQSANGTYDNEVDRANLQKEVDALKTEINRIADSANFNGIKLLDGSLDVNASKSVTADSAISGITTENYAPKGASDAFSASYITNRPEAQTKQTNASFTVKLDDVGVTGVEQNDTFTLKVGDAELTIKAAADGEDWGDGSKLAAKLVQAGKAIGGAAKSANNATTEAANSGTAKWDAEVGAAAQPAAAAAANKYVKIDGHYWEMTANGDEIKFDQVDFMAKGSDDVIPDYNVSFTTTDADAGGEIASSGTVNWQNQKTINGLAVGSSHQAQVSVEIDFSKLKDGDKLIAGEKTYVFKVGKDSTTAASGANEQLVDLSKIFAEESDLADEAKQAQAMVKITGDMGGANSATWSVGNQGVADGKGTLTFQSLSTYVGDATGAAAGTEKYIASNTNNEICDMRTEASVMKQFYSERPETGAAVSFNVDVTKIKAGDTFTIDGKTFEFCDGEASSSKNVAINLGDLGVSTGLLASQTGDVLSRIETAIEGAFNLSDGASKYEVSTDTASGKVILTSSDDSNTASIYENRTAAEMTLPTVTTTGSALTLQIGDTSDDFNQMKVSVGDMHVSAMGTMKDGKATASIADIDISNQTGAAAAVNVIKDAINYVSGVRGDLGAIQNRLDHTANNLSVMAENIQDAESTIRDTDVAEEMMSYVKNNILVQSAQAMLAQANQVPQGVLQLLG